LKKIIKFHKGKQRWNVENLYAVRQKAESFVEDNLKQSVVKLGNVNVQLKNINKLLLDSVIDFVEKVKRRPRKMWITKKMINKR
jgi:hypothetical protein